MKITILKCTDPTAWYSKLVGKTIPFESFEINRHSGQGIPENVFWCREGGVYNPINYVRASDVCAIHLDRLEAVELILMLFPGAKARVNIDDIRQ